MIRNTFRLALLGAVAVVLLGAVPALAASDCSNPGAVQEVEMTSELAAELGVSATVESQATDIEAIPYCPKDHTLQVCRITDPCTGQIFKDATCCPPGTKGACLIGITRDGCYTSVSAVCLGIVSP